MGEQFELVAAHIAIRHGDRTAIHAIPNALYGGNIRDGNVASPTTCAPNFYPGFEFVGAEWNKLPADVKKEYDDKRVELMKAYEEDNNDQI